MRTLSQILSCAAIAAVALSTRNARAQVVVTINDPFVQTSQVAGVTTEDFDSFATGSYTTLTSSIGTYTSPGMAIVPADKFGGVNGVGNYFVIGAESGQLTATLMLTQDRGYFGFWFSAGDKLNKVDLYENNTLEYTLDTDGLIGFINNRPNHADYYGNPSDSQDTGEPFAYVNFFGTNGTVFNKIVFTNASLASGFESDNHSVGDAAPVTGTPITPTTPEPGSLAFLATSALTGAGFYARRKKAVKLA